MTLPPPFGPVWNLRLFRRVCLAMFTAATAGCLACLVAGHVKAAAPLVLSTLIFGLNWNSVRHMTRLLERWAARHDRSQPTRTSPAAPPIIKARS